MKISYFSASTRAPIPSLGNSLIRPRPLLAVRITSHIKSRANTGFLDTGADDTVFDESYANILGIDLGRAPIRTLDLVGRPRPITCRYASVELGISDGIETYVWTATVGFVPVSLKYALLGYAGFLQYFDVTFHGAHREVVLVPNGDFPGTGP